MAATYHRPFAPHDCIGPISFAAAIHVAFSQPNTLIQETVRAFYTAYYRELVTVVREVTDGFIRPLEGCGLGMELLPEVNERAISRGVAPLYKARHEDDAVR